MGNTVIGKFLQGLMGPRVAVTITYPTPDETALETPEDVPTGEPGSPQVSYTLGTQHMPIWSPFELEHIKLAILYVGGQNPTGAAVTLYYRVLKNGDSVATGSKSIPAGEKYVASHYQFLDVQAGDVLACALWASAAGVNWNRKAVLVWPTRIGPKNKVLMNVATSDYTKVYSLGFGTTQYLGYATFYAITGVIPNFQATWRGNGNSISLIRTDPTYGLAQLDYGDRSISSSIITGTGSPAWYSNYCFRQLSFRPLNLRL